MKNFLLCLSLLFFCSAMSNAQVFKTVNLTTAGTLSDALTVDEKESVTHLTVSGSINADDFASMRNDMPFLGYINLSSANIAGDSIPDEALQYKTNLDSIDLPSSVVYIGKNAFRQNSLKKIDLPQNLKVIDENAFTWSEYLDSISLPSSVTFIGNSVFSHCKALKTISFPATLNHIGDYSFIRCIALEKFILDNSNPNFILENGALFNADKSKLILYPPKYPAIGYTVPSSVDSIASYAFFSNSMLSTLNLPASIEFIGTSAFDESDSLKEINVNAANPVFASEEGVLYDKEKKNLIKCPPNRTGTFIIPSTVTAIGMEAFAGCKLDSILLPQGLKEIGQFSFSGCMNLRSLIIPESVYLSYAPFSGCVRLTAIKLPKMDRIGPYTFSACRSLKSVTLPSMVTAIDMYAFVACDSLETVIIPGFVNSISDYAFTECPRMDSIIMYTEDPVQLNEGGNYFPQEIFPACKLYVPQGSKAAYSAAAVWQNFSIEEFPCDLQLSATEVQIGHSQGSTATFSIMSNTAWKITSDKDWIEIRDSLGILNGSVRLVASANPTNEERSAIVTVSGNGTEPVYVTVNQDAGILVITRLYEEVSTELFYHPATAEIIIKNAAGSTAKIYDMRGVINVSGTISSDNESLDISGLSEGVYILKVNGEILKFIK